MISRDVGYVIEEYDDIWFFSRDSALTIFGKRDSRRTEKIISKEEIMSPSALLLIPIFFFSKANSDIMSSSYASLSIVRHSPGNRRYKDKYTAAFIYGANAFARYQHDGTISQEV